MGSWRKTKAGLILILICTSITLVIGSICCVQVLSSDGFAAAVGIIGFVLFAPPFLVSAIFIGACLCCTAPYPPAKKRAVISVFCFVGSLVVPVLVVGLFLDAATGDRLAKGIFAASAVLGLVILTVYYYLFHVAVADFFQDASLRKFSILTMILAPAILTLLALLAMFHESPFDDWLRRTVDEVMMLPILVSITIILGMNSMLCIKTIRTIKRGTAATS